MEKLSEIYKIDECKTDILACAYGSVLYPVLISLKVSNRNVYVTGKQIVICSFHILKLFFSIKLSFMIQIALNGARPKSESLYIPNTHSEIKEDVLKLFNAGFNLFHIHIYDKKGNESLADKDVKEIISDARNISGKIQTGISTGDWIEPDFNKRVDHIRSWNISPDFASVNIVEEDSIEISRELIKKGIKIEAGITDPETAEKFAGSSILKDCIRILIEPQEQNVKDALDTVRKIELILANNNIKLKCLLHGFDLTAWDLFKEALKRGHDARIGLEDIVFLPSGKSASGNLELAEEALKIRSQRMRMG